MKNVINIESVLVNFHVFRILSIPELSNLKLTRQCFKISLKTSSNQHLRKEELHARRKRQNLLLNTK